MISGYEGSKPRQVLVGYADLPRVMGDARTLRSPRRPTTVPEPRIAKPSPARSRADAHQPPLAGKNAGSMAADDHPSRLSIGEVLKQARQRAGLEISVVEEETKIRTRYLRALEGEEWDALPGDVYTKSFLRTYAQLLGLDAEALVDEFRPPSRGPARRRPLPDHGADASHPQAGRPDRQGLGAGQGARHRRPDRHPAVVLLVLGLTGGEDGGEESPAPEIAKDDRRGGQERGSAEGRPARPAADPRRGRRRPGAALPAER